MTQYFTINEDKIILTDYGFENSLESQDSDGNTIPTVAYAIYNKTLAMPLTQDDLTLYKRQLVENTDYTTVLKGQNEQFTFLDLTESGYQKLLAIVAEQQKAPTTLNVPVIPNNRALEISITCDPDPLVINPLQNQTITFTATKADGSNFDNEAEVASIIWTAVLSYDGKDINNYGTTYYSVSGNVLTLDSTNPLEAPGVYQLYVTATIPMVGATDSNNVVISSQTFNITIEEN